MRIQETRFFELRACLVVAALISLGVSSNVGPRFFPLPAIANAQTTSESEPERGSASRQSHSEDDGFRVPMISQTQKRTDREPQLPDAVALSVKDALICLDDCRVAIARHYAGSIPKPPTVSLYGGRAPPDYV